MKQYVYSKNLSGKSDKWIIPSHLERTQKIQSETIRYWLVTITLTSGNVEFYIKARNHQEAILKAQSYDYIVNLKNKGKFSLLP